MEQTETKKTALGRPLFGAIVAPFAVFTAYLCITRWPSYHFTTRTDYLAIALSVVTGALFVVRLPLVPVRRAVTTLLYIPLLTALLVVYSFWFMALAFHEGL